MSDVDDRPGGEPGAAASPDRLRAWQRITEWPMAGLSLLFLAAYAWPVLDPGLPRRWQVLCGAVMAATWLLFVADYAIRLALAPRRWDFFRTNLLDVAIIVFPVLRPLRLLRFLTAMRLLDRRVLTTLRGHVAVYAALTTLLVLVTASLAVLDAEQDAPGANITAYGDALWWSAVTISSVGYGDYYPVTLQGRLVGTVLFIGGVALLGVVTGSVSSWFVEKVRGPEHRTFGLQAPMIELAEEVRALRARLEERGGEHGGRGEHREGGPG